MSGRKNTLELSLLGGFRARLASGEPVVLRARKSRALLAWLALHPDRAHPRETLAALLWSDRPEPRAHNSLSQAVTALRKGLSGAAPAPLRIEPASLAFASAVAEVDALAFERLAAGGRIADLERALDLYAGDLLAGIGVRDPAFEEWLDLERERLRALAVGAATRLLEVLAESNEHARATEPAQRLLALDPLQESAHRALMRGYAMQGQTGLALRQYRTCAETLRRELGVGPDPETERLCAEVRGRRGATPADAGAALPVARDPETTRSEAIRLASSPKAPAAPEVARPAAGVADAGSTAPLEGRPARRRAADPARPWTRTGVPALAIALLAAGAVLWVALVGRTPSPGAPADAPSIVVLPFLNLSDDPAQQYFADGMTEDLITDLAKISEMFVISRNSAFTYRDGSVPPDRIARELGVRYVLEGSVQRAGDEVRINAQLIDTETGGHLWAERYDGTAADVFALQDRITRDIVDALALELLPHERRRLARGETANAAAHDAYLLGLSAYYRRTPEANARAAEHLERALALDDGYTAAYSVLAKVYARAMLFEQAYADALRIHWSEGYTRARDLLTHTTARPNADVHVLRSWLALHKHQHARAIAQAERALALAPNDADALEALAESLIYAGRVDEGVEFARRAMRRNPSLPAGPLYLLALAAFERGEPGAAVARLERATEHAPAPDADRSGLRAAALGEMGRTDEAREAFRAFSESFLARPDRAWSVRTLSFANPRFHTWRRIDLAWSTYSFPFAREETLARLAHGLEAAGAPASVGGYLPLHRGNRLDSAELRSLLLGTGIEGTDFWLSEHVWRQHRGRDGSVEHTGYPIHPGLPTSASGRGHIEGDRLCERWPALGGRFDVCVTAFRVPEKNARVRWGDYVMVTDTGPHPFSVR